MKIALMQPYFFPYIGYFQLIKSVDEFVIFDNAQYTKRSWITRNRILNEHKDSVFINIPVKKAHRDTKIKDINIDHQLNWQDKLFGQLFYYKNAPNYYFILDFLDCCIRNTETSLSLFNTNLILKTCELLNIPTKITILSENYPNIQMAKEADEWGIELSLVTNADTYINAIGGKEFYNQQKYKQNGIDIKFIQSQLIPYKQFGRNFIAGLSIIDVLMFNDLKSISEMINQYELIS